MKRIWSALLALVLTLSLAAAPAAWADAPEPAAGPASWTGWLLGIRAAFPNGFPTGPEGLALPDLPADGPVQTCGLDLSRYGEGEGGLYPLDSLVDQWVTGEISGADLWGSLLLLRMYQYGETEDTSATVAVVLDLSDGSLVARLELPGAVSCGFLEDGTFWTTLMDTAACEAILYDGNYEPDWVWTREPVKDGESAYLRFSGDGRFLLYGHSGEKYAELIDVDTGERTSTEMPCDELWNANTCGSRFYLPQYTGEDGLAILDGTTGEVTRSAIDLARQVFYGPLTVRTGEGLLALSAAEEPGVLLTELPGGGFFSVDYREGWLLGSGAQATAVNCADGSYRAAELPKDSYLSFGALSDMGFAVLGIWEGYGSRQQLYLWDYLSAEAQGVGTFYPEGLAGRVDAYADELEARYGVELYYRGEGNDFDIDYVARFSDDDMQIYSTLKIVDEVLGRLPEGMLRELCSRAPKRVRIFLAGTLYRAEPSGINNAAAVTFTDHTGRTIVLDIGQGSEIRSHLPHEFSHLLDSYMEELLAEEGLSLDELWNTGNPDWFSYRMDYNDANGYTYGDPRYTLEAGDEANAWFMRGYSKTYPTEDRATVMEAMFWDSDDLRGEHLQNKGMLLGAILRHCFASVRASGACWEENFPAGYEADYADLFVTDGQPLEPKG